LGWLGRLFGLAGCWLLGGNRGGGNDSEQECNGETHGGSRSQIEDGATIAYPKRHAMTSIAFPVSGLVPAIRVLFDASWTPMSSKKSG
jgi:hypothetical protein